MQTRLDCSAWNRGCKTQTGVTCKLLRSFKSVGFVIINVGITLRKLILSANIVKGEMSLAIRCNHENSKAGSRNKEKRIYT